ncbi:MAG: type IV pilus modification protein PilV [Gammaproteobacteria bacterium]|nr:type IV pilus modification protein PilV [Gammaproteobacteria bacterium]
MSLIEVLVALLVLGIGVMGYAALQLNAVKITEDTYSRSQAMAIAQDLIERMRANVNSDTVLSRYTAYSESTAPPAKKTCFSSPPDNSIKFCTADEMAAADIYQSRRYAQTMLSGGAIAVADCDGVTCVTVAWNQTTPASCNQSNVIAGEWATKASCVIVEFIP